MYIRVKHTETRARSHRARTPRMHYSGIPVSSLLRSQVSAVKTALVLVGGR